MSGPRSSEVIAVNNCLRYVFSAAASAFVLPLIQAIGVGWTNTFAAAMCWVGCGLVLVTIRYGKRMRQVGERREGMFVPGAEQRREGWSDGSTRGQSDQSNAAQRRAESGTEEGDETESKATLVNGQAPSSAADRQATEKLTV